MHILYKLQYVTKWKEWLIDWLWSSETMSLNSRHQRAYCLAPGHMWAWTTMVILMIAGDNSWLVHHSCLEVLPAETSVVSRTNRRRSENFAYQYMKYLNGSLTWRKILRYGTSGFTFHPKEGVLRNFIALKNPSPRPGLNQRTLGLVASTLTTTPPTQLNERNCWLRNMSHSPHWGHNTSTKTMNRTSTLRRAALHVLGQTSQHIGYWLSIL
jgi:hypothetical protein